MDPRNLKHVSRGETITAEHYNDLVDAIKALTVEAGKGVILNRRGIGGTVLSVDPAIVSGDTFFAKITASTLTAANSNKYIYSWQEVVKTDLGYDNAWEVKDGGRSGSYNAYNTIEIINTSSGTLGNGVGTGSLVGTFKLKPCPNGNIVQMFTVRVGETTEYWFSYENGVDGDCP